MFTSLTSTLSVCSKIGRRDFLRTGTLAILSTSLYLGSGAQAFGQNRSKAETEGSSPRKSALQLTRSTFAPLVSEYFLIQVNGEDHYLQLLEISDLKNPSIDRTAHPDEEEPSFKSKVKEESFTLLFRSSNNVMQLHQKTWELKHGTLGRIEIFLVPVRHAEGPWHFYEAVFNRLQK